ncbi:hypothetical protein Tco_0959862 [Tanacetum coccineum]
MQDSKETYWKHDVYEMEKDFVLTWQAVKEEKDGSEGSLEWAKKAKTEPDPVCGYGNANRVETNFVATCGTEVETRNHEFSIVDTTSGCNMGGLLVLHLGYTKAKTDKLVIFAIGDESFQKPKSGVMCRGSPLFANHIRTDGQAATTSIHPPVLWGCISYSYGLLLEGTVTLASTM